MPRATLGDLVQIVRRPVGDEARRLLATNWESLDPAMRVPQQMFGRQGNGCGATIGAMPRCDFSCRGCYLTDEANTVPAESVAAIKAQLRALRPTLGHAGNIQLTDGEVTLRPAEELIELLQYAQSLGLIPMLMTHGDSCVATTMTVTRENLDGVPEVVRWLTRNTDAFRLISFLPIAQVGRTETGFGGGVSVDALWDRIADGLGVPGGSARTQQMGVWFGHQSCNRMVNGFVVSSRGTSPTFHALRDGASDVDVRAVDGFLARFGGVSFRLDDRRALLLRALGLLRLAPRFFAGILPTVARHWLRRVGQGSAWRGAWQWWRGEARVTPLVIVSHHFMSRDEIDSPLGRERLAHCVFKVPVNGDLLSMCQVNATGVRERSCQALATRNEHAVT